MILLALDLGTSTGWCVGDAPDATVVLSGVEKLRPGKYDSYGMGAVRFEAMLEKLHAGRRFDHVVYEAVRAHKGTDAAHVYGGLMTTLQKWCEKRAIPCEGVAVGAIKKFATGKGNAGKDAMIAAVTAWGYQPETSDQADAVALFHAKITGAV